MLKRLIRGQTISWVPAFAVLAITMTVIFLITMVTNQITVYCEIYRAAFFYVPPISSGLLGIAFPVMAACYAMPPLVYSYRTTRQGSDAYQQSAHGPHTVQRVRLLVGLGMLVAAFSVAYVIGVLVFTVRYAVTPAQLEQVFDNEIVGIYFRKTADLSYYCPTYFYLVGAILAQYGVNCLACSFGNSKATQLILMAGVGAITSFFLVAPATFVSQAVKDHFTYWAEAEGALQTVTLCDKIAYYGLGPYAPVQMASTVFDGLVGATYGPGNPEPDYWGHVIAAASFHLGIGLPCLALAFFRKEPSGELAGVDGTSNAALSMVPHIAVLLAGIMLTTVAYSRGTRILYTGILLAGYYAVLAVFRHSFRLRKIDWYALATISIVLLSISIGYNPKHSRLGW